MCCLFEVVGIFVFFHLSIMLAEQSRMLFCEFGLCRKDVCVWKTLSNCVVSDYMCASELDCWPQVHVVCNDVLAKCRSYSYKKF